MTNSKRPLELDVQVSGEHFRFHTSRRGAKGRFGFTWTLGAGKKGPPEHVHPGETESFRVVSGVLRVFVRGVPNEVRAGQSIAVSPGTPHSFHNPGAEPVVVEVSLDGTAMEDQMIPAALHFEAIDSPKAKDFARMLVHDVEGRASVPTSAVLRSIFLAIVVVLRGFGVRGFDRVEDWERNLA